MADRLRIVASVAASFVLAVASAGLGAQPVAVSLADPTKPPSTFTTPAALVDELRTGPDLQSVVIPEKGADGKKSRPVAIIGGQEVRLGEMLGERRLTRLTEREAVLEGPDGIERLLLTPGIEKTNITRKSVAAKRAPRGSKP